MPKTDPSGSFNIRFDASKLSGLAQQVRDAEQAEKNALKMVREAQQIYVQTVNALASINGRPVTSVRAADSYVNRNLLGGKSSGTPSSSQIFAAIGSNPSAAATDIAQAARRREQTDADHRAQYTFHKQVRGEQQQYRGSDAGQAEQYMNTMEKRSRQGQTYRYLERGRMNTPQGRQDLYERSAHAEYKNAQETFVRQNMRGEARKAAARDLGIALPTDLSTFQQALTSTFRSAASVGMLEAMAGGKIAPMARMLGETVLQGIMLPAAGNALLSMGGLFRNAGSSKSMAQAAKGYLAKGSSPQQRQALSQQAAQQKKGMQATAETILNSGDVSALDASTGVGQSGGGAISASVPPTGGGTTGGNATGAAIDPALTSNQSNTIGPNSNSTDQILNEGMSGNSAGVGVAALTGGSAIIQKLFRSIPGIGGALGGILGLITGVGAIAGGAGLLYSSKQSEIATTAQQMWAATSGPQAANPNVALESALSLSQKYSMPVSTVLGAQSILAGMGMQYGGAHGQGLKANTENALVLSSMTGADPNTMASLVGTISAGGGISANGITKMIEMMSLQNTYTKDNGVSLDAIVASTTAMEQASGGLTTNSNTIAGLSGVAHVLSQNMGSAGRLMTSSGATGSLMGNLLGTTGMQTFITAGLLGISPDQLAHLQAPNTKGGAGQLFDRSVSALWKMAPGRNATGAATREMLAPMIFGSQFSQMSKAEQTAFVNMNPNDVNAMATQEQIYAKSLTAPSIPNFLNAAAVNRDSQVSAGDKLIIAADRAIISSVEKNSPYWQTLPIIGNTLKDFGPQFQSMISLLNKATGGTAIGAASGGANQGTGTGGRPGGIGGGIGSPHGPYTNTGGTGGIAQGGAASTYNGQLPFGINQQLPNDQGTYSAKNIYAITANHGGVPFSTPMAQALMSSGAYLGIDPRALAALTTYEDASHTPTGPQATGPYVPGMGSAYGVMQMMPSTLSSMLNTSSTSYGGNTWLNPFSVNAKKGDRSYYNPNSAVDQTMEGSFYLRYLMDQHGGSLQNALAGYTGNYATGGNHQEVGTVLQAPSNWDITIVVQDKTSGGVTASVTKKTPAKGKH